MNNEINILVSKLNNQTVLDIHHYNKICAQQGFQSQRISSHHLYNQLDSGKLQNSNNYMISLYSKLKTDLITLPLITHSSQTIESKLKATIYQALIGDALGFVVENEPTLEEMQKHFPLGVIDPKNLSIALATNCLNTVYGKYNNNNLNAAGKLIYSDDTELSLLVLYTALDNYHNDRLNQESFIIKLIDNLTSHWHDNLKLSGKYGVDGLYYGTRGYGKQSLQVLSDLYHHKNIQNNSPNNGSLIRSWPLGLMSYDSYRVAALMAVKQSLITNKSYNTAICCGAMAAAVHISIYAAPKSKEEVVDKMIDIAVLLEGIFLTADDYKNKDQLTSTYLKYGKSAALNDVNPVIFYNSALGCYAKEALSGVVFSFLRHQYFLTSMVETIHTPGDSDSIANLTGALIGAYYGMHSFPEQYLEYIETPNLTLHGNEIKLELILEAISIKKASSVLNR